MARTHSNIKFPAQKKSMASKTKKWRKECVNGGEAAAIWRNEGLRQAYRTKRVNYDLYSDILDQKDIEKICNPLGVVGLNAPAKMQNYPICNPKIDLLVGESIRRKFDWKVRVTNPDAISAKEEEQKAALINLITSHIVDPEKSEDQIKQELIKFQNYMDFEFQDTRERAATQILQYLYKHLNLDYLFSKGFKDALISAEEVYHCDIIAGEPVVERINPLNIHTVRSGESPYFEDADIIVIDGYKSPGQIIDDYHEYLTPRDINYIEEGMVGNASADSAIDIGYKPDLPIKVDDAIDASILANDLTYGSPFDNNGNIKVTKVLWKSMRKLKKVKYYDEFGEMNHALFDENYVIDPSRGEEEEILWVSEWWEGHKIGGSAGDIEDHEAIYVKMQPRPVQFRSMENPSKCHPGVVGTVYNTNDNEGVSLMDRMKPYQYLYNVLAYNAELAIAKNYGKIMRIDLASIPENWQIDQWLSFAQGMNAAFYDSFKEGNKGASQGKIAGGVNPQAPVIDMEMGNTIQLYLNMMSYIKQELGEIAGVSQARQGQIHNRQAVGNTQMEMNQSSHITEYWFNEHDYVKKRVLECLLETAKYAWKDNKNKKIQYVLDDGINMMLNLDGEQFNEAEYGLLITDGAASHELLQTMKQLAHAGLQNGLINFSQLIDIYSTESMASIRRKIERAETAKQEQDAQKEQQAYKMQKDSIAAQAKEAERAREFKREEWDREDSRNKEDNDTKIEIEKLRQDNQESRFYIEDEDNGKDEITLEKLKNDANKINKDYQVKQRAQKETERHNKKTEEQKDKELEIKKKASSKKEAKK
jgi:hypothetical protein